MSAWKYLCVRRMEKGGTSASSVGVSQAMVGRMVVDGSNRNDLCVGRPSESALGRA